MRGKDGIRLRVLLLLGANASVTYKWIVGEERKKEKNDDEMSADRSKSSVKKKGEKKRNKKTF